MPVILIGAIGGLIYKGIMGLCVRAVVLAVSYKMKKRISQVEDGGESPVAKGPI